MFRRMKAFLEAACRLFASERFRMILCGLLFTLGFAPLFLWPVALLGLALALRTVWRASSARAAWGLGFWFSFAHHLSALYWIPRSFYVETGSWWPVWTAGVPALVVLCAYLALYGALAFCAAWVARRAFARLLEGRVCPFFVELAGAAVFPVVWVAGEWLRGWVLTGFPWNLAGYVFADSLPLMQGAAVGQVWLLSFVAAFAAALSAVRGAVGKTAAAGLLVFVWAAGAARVEGYSRVLAGQSAAARALAVVRLVQPNVPQSSKWEDAQKAAVLDRTLQVTVGQAEGLARQTVGFEGLSGGEEKALPQLVIWPETAITFFWNEDPALADIVGGVLGPQQRLIVGAPRFERVEEGAAASSAHGRYRFYNSLYVVDGDGRVQDRYSKRLLVMFGEYLPLRFLMPQAFQDIVGREDYAPGREDVRLDVGYGLKVVPAICFEGVFPSYVAAHAKGADFLLSVTNDAWFDGTSGPQQHYAMARMRAVETGLSLVRVGNSGVTAIVDGLGREVGRLPVERAGVLDGVVFRGVDR